MAYELYRVNKNNSFAQTELIENVVKLKWQDDITNVFISFEFETTEILECGDWIELFETDNSETVFYGLITKVTQTNVNTYLYNGYDYGYYLEKNNTVIQFDDATISNAIKEICDRGQLRMGQIANIEQKVTKIYKNETLSKILFEIYKIAVDKGLKDRYYYDCTKGSVNLFAYTRNDNLQGFIANMYAINSLDTIIKYTKISSMDTIRNNIEIWTPLNPTEGIGDKQDSKPNNDSIEKYGLLTHIVRLDGDKKTNYKELLEKKLNELNKLNESLSLKVFADYHWQRGVITLIENDLINLHGLYKVTSTKHNLTKKTEEVEITIERYVEN